MSTRLDLTIQKHPTHEEGIRLLAARDPSGNLKYLDWGAKILASDQALAPEVADVLELFHRFAGQRVHIQRSSTYVRPDIYSYRPQDLAGLRDTLNKLQRARDKKQKKRERLYRIEGTMEADVVYDGPDLIVRHIKNKEASVHYGLSTKWCISMLRENYFEDYETHNATFFFLERKTRKGDEFDKVALMMPRTGEDGFVEAFTSVDRRVDMMVLARTHGPGIFDIFREIWERSEVYPGSAMACIYNGSATREQIESVVVNLGKVKPYETDTLIEAICCNDAAPWLLLEEILRRAPALSLDAKKRSGGRRRHRSRHQSGSGLLRTIEAALLIHPATPAEVREKLGKDLRRRHVNTNEIHRVRNDGPVGVAYEPSGSPRVRGGRIIMRNGRRRYIRRRQLTLSALRLYIVSCEKRVVRLKKKLTLL